MSTQPTKVNPENSSRQSRFNKRTVADFKTRHRKWPLGTPVLTLTPLGYRTGKVNKHWRNNEVEAGCTVNFFEPLDFMDGCGPRYCHVIPFRNMKHDRALNSEVQEKS